MKITKTLLPFLNGLRENNHKEWFEQNKSVFQKEEESLKLFFDEITAGLNSFDDIEKTKIFRIYKDVRFSKDKTPYKTNRSANWTWAGDHRRGSYYLQIEPGNSFLAGGFFEPNPADLLRIRKEFERDDNAIRNIFEEAGFKSTYTGFEASNQVKTAPKGFDKAHPAIDLIKNKSFFVVQSFIDEEVLSEAFVEVVVQHFKLLLPFLDYMSEVVTTDLNGVSLLKR